MKISSYSSIPFAIVSVLFLQILVLAWCDVAPAQDISDPRVDPEIKVVVPQGMVEVSTDAAKSWEPVRPNQILKPFDLLRTEANSRCSLIWSDRSVVVFGSSTEIQIVPPQSPSRQAGLRLIGGIFSFFHRDKPGQIQVITRGATAGIEGTEFAMNVDQATKTTVSVIDGTVKFGNEYGTLLVTNGQQAVAVPGQSPTRSAGFIANDILQWMFYYPAVLDLNDLQFADAEKRLLQESLATYQAGNLAGALECFPSQAPDSAPVKVYYAALLLSVGNVDGAQKILGSMPDISKHDQQLALALRRLISAVKHQPDASRLEPQMPSELLADSYYEQSRAFRGTSLQVALARAKQAVAISPEFAQAWERVAEIEFSFGDIKSSASNLNKSLALAPQNPKALVLKGFLLAAQNRPKAAANIFDQALAVNPAIGDAWLGRGLCEIRLGDGVQGRENLLIAAAIEPQRAELRSYLGKAYADAGDFSRAEKELDLAKRLDPADPTAWFYSALLNQERSRINTAIDDMEKSKELNDNRRIYRSDHLLDQDQAVRGANLAAMYRDDQMPQIGLAEAQTAINQDYDNYSAHLFLANTYDQLRDPNEIDTRYETPDLNEYLLANLLAPANAGTLSPTISQGEYSRMFQRNGFGVTSETEFLSRGAWTESGDQYGTFNNFSYDFSSFYRSDPGVQPDGNIEQRQLSLALKQQLTLQDTVYFQVSDYQMNGGGLTEYYDPAMANQFLTLSETERPIVSLGYNHEWDPGVNTLLYVTRLNDRFSLTNADLLSALVYTPYGTSITGIDSNLALQQNYTELINIYSGELQQIFEIGSHTTILGARFQYGHFNTGNLENYADNYAGAFPQPDGTPDALQFYSTLFRRISVYGYHEWEILDSLRLIGGVAYDDMLFPQNFRNAPISGQEQTEHQVSPKAGLIWTPANETTIRAAYTRSLQGASLDETAQIEPSQVAGFIQSYGSIIPGSVVGSTAGAHFETYDLSLEQRFPTRTYLTLSAEMLNSTVDQVYGVFDYSPALLDGPAVPAGLENDLNYHERTLSAAANQLLGKNWSLGAQYRWSQAVLENDFPTVPTSVILPQDGGYFLPYQKTKGLLNQVELTAIYNHPSGFFAKGGATWYSQANSGYVTQNDPSGEPGDSFWELNAFVGYRSPQRRIETSVGLLNIGNQGYNLNPLNIYNQLPYKRTIAFNFQINF
jgi:tetratricopeptide (TPR) repeat protein